MTRRLAGALTARPFLSRTLLAIAALLVAACTNSGGRAGY